MSLEYLDPSYTRVLRKNTKSHVGTYGTTFVVVKSVFEDLLYSIEALPGVTTSGLGIYHTSPDKYKMILFFSAREDSGLFFLSRCTSNRYGGPDAVNIKVDVSDIAEDGKLPITFHLESDYKSLTELEEIAKSLIINMHEHLNLFNFITGYDLDLNKFHIIDRIALDRSQALEDIGI